MEGNAVRELLRLKEEIEKAERQKQELSGRFQVYSSELKKEFGIEVAEAQNKLTQLEKEIEKERESISRQLTKLTQAYEWE